MKSNTSKALNRFEGIIQIKYSIEKLFSAINTGDNNKVLALIVLDNTLLKKTNERGLTPLMDAVICKNYDAMRLMLLHGVDTDQRDEDGWTAKSWAIFIQDKTAQKLLSKPSVLCHSDDVSGMVFGSLAFNE